MNKWLIYLASLTILLVFFSFQSGVLYEIVPKETISLDELHIDPTTAIVRIDRWKLFSGDVDLTGADELLVLDQIEYDNSILHIFDTKYMVLALPTDKLELPTTSGWRIDLNKLSAKGITESGNIIMMPDCPNPPFVCVYDPNSTQIQCLLRSDVSETGVGALGLAAFELYLDDKPIQHIEQAEAIWNIHIGNKSFQTATPILDGDWEYHSMKMIHKDCPALHYELNFGICDSSLYIENQNNNQIICVPVNQFT